MKQNKFVAASQLDAKIDDGLKILEFATQYNLRKAYYRNSPFNAYTLHNESSNSKIRTQQAQQHAANAELMMQLNEEVANWGRESYRIDKSANKSAESMKKDMAVPQLSRQDSSSSSSSSSNHSHDAQPEHQEALPLQPDNIDDLSNYQSQGTKRKLKSIKEDLEDGSSIHPTTKSQITKVINIPPIQNRSEIINFSDLNSIQSHHDSSNRSHKTTRQKIEPVQKPTQNVSKFANKNQFSKHSPSNHHETSKRSNQSSIIHSKTSNKHSHISSKSSNSVQSAILDKSISRIVSHSSQLPSQSLNRSNTTEFSLMRELSSSFQDGENMKLLLKLENCELEQSYLERRIINRLEKGYKQVHNIMSISWQSLKLPRMQSGFVRPNYAHVID